MSTPRTAVYPGSFDPPTVGHLDILARALHSTAFDNIVIAIVRNPNKKSLFTIDERAAMLREAFEANPALHDALNAGRLQIDAFEGLLVSYAKAQRATAIIRGLRAVSDYEYELQMAHMNRRLFPGAETLFFMARDEYSYVSSRLTKEVAFMGGDVRGLVPENVYAALMAKVRDAGV